MSELERDELDAITSSLLDAIAAGEPSPPLALTFLLRQYQSGAIDDTGDLIGAGLASALARYRTDESTGGRAAWLSLFSEAAACSSDERLQEAAVGLIEQLSENWAAATHVDEATVVIDACLRAADLTDARTFVPRAVDELER